MSPQNLPGGAGTNAATPVRPAEKVYMPLAQGQGNNDGDNAPIDTAGSMWHSEVETKDPSFEDDCYSRSDRHQHAPETFPQEIPDISTTLPPRPASPRASIPEQLAWLLMDMLRTPKAQMMADAFLRAAEHPPITRQSLGELDIQSIIANPKLRHDVNHDRDLSFRPNTDGSKGQQKRKEAERYWFALEAEFELYALIHLGNPSLPIFQHTEQQTIMTHMHRRLPIMFTTIQEILKGLVPDRDHVRVDEHLDVPKLMQEIERGVCDLVRLAEWVAALLKEHCAPMRDVSVDKMVLSIRMGVETNCSQNIVDGMRQLLGILESMKLDVANHQIRSLKTLLIEDTVYFEQHYHLERIVNGRARIRLEGAHQWYSTAVAQYRQQCTPSLRDPNRFNLEVFVRALVATLFNSPHSEFPDTFYLDQERLRILKAETDDLIYFDICFEMFEQVLRELGYSGNVPTGAKQALHASLSAIMGDALGHGLSRLWISNSEHIMAEILRQARVLTGHTSSDRDYSPECSQSLRKAFENPFPHHTKVLEEIILADVLTNVVRHHHSSPTDLFNALVALPPPPAVPQSNLAATLFNKPVNPPTPYSGQLTDISARISHVAILHWRIWGEIAYIRNDDTSPTPMDITVGAPVGATAPQSMPSHATKTVENGSTESNLSGNIKSNDQHEPGQEQLEYPAQP